MKTLRQKTPDKNLSGMSTCTAVRHFVARLCLMGWTIVSGPLYAGEQYSRQHKHPEGYTVVVAEGEFEPRSIGSFSVKVYVNGGSGIPTDNFVCGLIRSRDGVVEDVLFADVNGNGRKETVVTTRCVGTGSFLSAHAFTFNNGNLHVTAAVSGLPKDADCLAALRKAPKRTPNKPNQR